MRVALAAAAIGLMAFAAEQPAPAGEAGAPAEAERSVSRPDWDRRPTADDMARFYPKKAQRLELEGRATILCNVQIDGRLSDCRVIEESPEGMGFGESAIKLSTRFRMKPATVDGVAVAGASVRIPLVYKLPEDAPLPPPAPPLDLSWLKQVLMSVAAAIGAFCVLALGLIAILDLRRRPRND